MKGPLNLKVTYHTQILFIINLSLKQSNFTLLDEERGTKFQYRFRICSFKIPFQIRSFKICLFPCFDAMIRN